MSNFVYSKKDPRLLLRLWFSGS